MTAATSMAGREPSLSLLGCLSALERAEVSWARPMLTQAASALAKEQLSEEDIASATTETIRVVERLLPSLVKHVEAHPEILVTTPQSWAESSLDLDVDTVRLLDSAERGILALTRDVALQTSGELATTLDSGVFEEVQQSVRHPTIGAPLRALALMLATVNLTRSGGIDVERRRSLARRAWLEVARTIDSTAPNASELDRRWLEPRSSSETLAKLRSLDDGDLDSSRLGPLR